MIHIKYCGNIQFKKSLYVYHINIHNKHTTKLDWNLTWVYFYVPNFSSTFIWLSSRRFEFFDLLILDEYLGILQIMISTNSYSKTECHIFVLRNLFGRHINSNSFPYKIRKNLNNCSWYNQWVANTNNHNFYQFTAFCMYPNLISFCHKKISFPSWKEWDFNSTFEISYMRMKKEYLLEKFSSDRLRIITNINY